MLTTDEIKEVLQNFQKLEVSNPQERRKTMFMGQKIQKDQLVWFRNEQPDENDSDNSIKPFYAANILKVAGDNLVLKLSPQELQPGVSECRIQKYLSPSFEIQVEKTMEYSVISEQGIADMVEIDELNHATLLYNLYKRYIKDEIYTYVGPILLAMNPFKNLDYLYTEEQVQNYKKIINSKQPYEERKNMPPHIFAITAMAFKQMIESKQKQAIVISGESGAGKTESAKCAMKFLTKLSQKERKSDMNLNGSSRNSVLNNTQNLQQQLLQSDNLMQQIDASLLQTTGIEQKILDTNPVLEAFGNSKTVRNNNSSRFGKYVILYFSHPKGEILGARVKNYLLEKSRVVGPAQGERNYHVFYHLLRGASLDLLQDLGLINQLTGDRLDFQDFNFLKKGTDVDQKIINDAQLYKELALQFQNLGFTQEEQRAVWRITAACLHLGELSFDDSTYDENGKPCSVTNPERIQLIAKILGIQNPQDLITELVNKPSTPGIQLRAPLKKHECVDARDSLAKCLYDNLFNWLVERMNLTILPETSLDDDAFKLETKTIGLLDIFGFENFKENNFEQMCINYVNEKLHKLYISAIFDAEKFELRNEGLGDRVNQLKYPDLTSLDVIKLLDEKLQTGFKTGGKAGDAKIGIFNIINDCSTQKPRPTWETLIKRIDDMHKNTSENSVYNREKVKEKFKIRHSAKEVIYTAKQFIERNVDDISNSLEGCIQNKADRTIAIIFQGITGSQQNNQEEEKKTPAKQSFGQKKTIWHKFSDQMQDLMNELAEPLLDFKQQDGQTDDIPQIKKGQSQFDSSKKLNTAIEIEPCSLHFIRCIKPNDFKQQDLFIHAMCLQQITYMGVLESIDVKQKNYPYRKSFEEFYQRYELLSPIYGTIRYENMTKSTTDFKQLSVTILNEAFQGFKEFYAVGKTKILMRNECVALLEKAKSKQREVRDKSAVVIKRAFQMFLGFTNTQEQLNKSLRDRQKIIKTIENYNTIQRLRKYYVCFTMSRWLFDRAFDIGKSRAEERSIRLVQRIFRGFTARDKKMNLVVNALKAKENLKLHVAAKRVQKRLRGMIVRNRMLHLHLTAQRIQGFFKMKWHKEFFSSLRNNVITIQRSIRRFLARRDIIKQRLVSYIGQELNILRNVKQIENYQLYGAQADGAALQEIIKPHTPYSMKKIQLFLKTIDMHILTDLQEIYSQPWSTQWMKLSKDCLVAESPIMQLQVGSTHTLAINQKGRLYCWGWNDNGQCAKNINEQSEVIIRQSSKAAQVFLNENQDQFNSDIRIKQVVAAQDRCLILLNDSQDIIAWGGNERGQLGLGTYDDEFIPKRIDFFSKQGIKISGIAASGDLTLCACENGEGYAWPFQRGGTTFSLPVKMPFSEKIKISRVSCGYNFGFFISTQGLIYALGKDNSDGQLGLGHVYPRDVPELITSLKDIGERIDSAECGYRHVIAKSTLGKIYTWGWGAKGQLGHGHYDSEISPRLLVIEKNKHKEKAIQIAAGFSHSLIMLDNNRELLWFGTSGSLNMTSRPQTLRLSDILPDLFPEQSLISFSTGQQIDFAVVKIMGTWSKTMSLSNILIADLRQVNGVQSWNKIQSTLQQLATKWDPREVMPPYLDTVSGMFNSSMMKMTNGTSSQTNKNIAKDKSHIIGASFNHNNGKNSGINHSKLNSKKK
eukprot:403346072